MGAVWVKAAKAGRGARRDAASLAAGIADNLLLRIIRISYL